MVHEFIEKTSIKPDFLKFPEIQTNVIEDIE